MYLSMCGVCEGGLGAVNMEGYKWEMIFKEETLERDKTIVN